MKEYNIVQIGTFDVENYGDLLFPVVLKNQLETKIKIKEIYMFSPNGGKQPFYNKKVYPIKELEKIIITKKIDLIIIGGGDLLRLDKKIANSYSKSYEPAISIWQLPILLAIKYKIKIVFNALGVPFPFTNEQLHFIPKLLDYVDYLNVRDEISKRNLGYEENNKCVVVPDTINIISNIYTKQELNENLVKLQKKKIIPKVKKYVVLQTKKITNNKELYIKKLKELINYIINVEKKHVIIMPIGYVHNDIDFCSKLFKKNDKNMTLIKEKLHPYDMLSVLASSDGYIGTSLHGIITSNAYNVPIMAINTDQLLKISGFLKIAKKENLEVIDINELLIKYKLEFSVQKFDENEKIKNRINNHFEKIKNILNSNEKTKTNLFEYNLLDYISKLGLEKEKILQDNKILKEQLNICENNIKKILNSKSFKVTAPLRKTVEKVNKVKTIVNINPKKNFYNKKLDKKIAIQIHIFYPELLEEIYQNILIIPYQFDLYISTNTKMKEKIIKDFFKEKKYTSKVCVEVFENKGRDIYPFIEQMKPVIKDYDYLLHLHTKKSKHSWFGDDWRKYLYYNLLGNEKNVREIFYMFEKKKKLGLIFPDTYFAVRTMMQIGASANELNILIERLKINEEFNNMFPAGSMFWAKTDAIIPLFENVYINDFAEEKNQVDGTFAHAIERIFVILAQSRGYMYVQKNNSEEGE